MGAGGCGGYECLWQPDRFAGEGGMGKTGAGYYKLLERLSRRGYGCAGGNGILCHQFGAGEAVYGVATWYKPCSSLGYLCAERSDGAVDGKGMECLCG